MINTLLGYFSYDLGIDLGSSNIYIAQKDQGIVINQPCVIALSKKNRQIVAVGDKAKEMLGKSPDTIEVIYPLKGGVISDLDAAEKILSYYVKEIHKISDSTLPKIPRPKVVISIPYDTTEVERRALVNAAKSAGCRQVNLVESTIAAAIGIGLNIMDPKGNLIVDIGGGTTEVAIISLGGVVLGQSLKLAGLNLDEALISYIKNRFSVLIGFSGSELVKNTVADFSEKTDSKEKLKSVLARGRNIKTGLPQIVKLSNLDVTSALNDSIDQIIDSIKLLVEETPPELIADIIDNGIYLVGALAKTKGLSERIFNETKIKVVVPQNCELQVALGCLSLLEQPQLLKLVSKKVN